MPRQAVLTYDGTRLHSSGAHAMRATTSVAAGEALENFRLRCTDAPPATFVRIDLRNSGVASKAYIASVHSRFAERFGPPRADYGRRDGGMSNWFIDDSLLLTALRLLDELRPIPADSFGFGALSVNYKLDFIFRDAATNALLPFQRQEDYLNFEAEHERYFGRSYVSAEFSARSCVSAFFTLPFEDWNAEAANHVRFIERELPFRISEKRWKRWHLTKTGTSYLGRKIRPSWASGHRDGVF